MLDRLRGHQNSWVTWVVGGILAFFMTFFGLSTGFLSRVHPIATVNGKQILADEVDKQATQLRNLYQQMYGGNAVEALKGMNLREQALDMLIVQQLVEAEATRLGIRISTTALQQKIASDPNFQHDGQFDFDRYQELLRDNGLLPHEYEDRVREEMTSNSLKSMIDLGIDVSSDEVRHAYDLRNQKIALSYIEFDAANFTAGISPTSAQLEDFYKKFHDEFVEPERVKIEFIHYVPAVMAAKVTPSDSDIETYYKDHLKSNFTHPEEAHARHILVSVAAGATPVEKDAAHKKALDILKQAKSGADFAKLAAKYSDDPSNKFSGGDLGSFSRGQMVKPFEDAVFKMKPGEITLVETSFGFHVVKLDTRTPAHVDTLAEAKPTIIETIRTEEGARLARNAVNEDLSAALAGASLDDLAKKRGLDVVETAEFARNEPIKGVADPSALIDAAFKADVGQVRGVPGGGSPYLIKLVARNPAHVPPLKEIADKVREALVKTTAADKAHAEAVKVLAQIKGAGDFAAVAAENKMPVKNVPPFVRSSNDIPGIGQFPEVADAAGLAVAFPAMIGRVMERSGSSYIFEITARADPSENEWKNDEKEFTEQYLANRRQVAWQRFLEELKADARITIDSDQLGAATSSM
jgi:peptidyl-prolyl cis-trans isomerase D